MRIQWKAAVPPDWASLLRAWRDPEKMIQITAQMRALVAIGNGLAAVEEAIAEAARMVRGDSGEGNILFRSDVDNLSSSAKPALPC